MAANSKSHLMLCLQSEQVGKVTKDRRGSVRLRRFRLHLRLDLPILTQAPFSSVHGEDPRSLQLLPEESISHVQVVPVHISWKWPTVVLPLRSLNSNVISTDRASTM